VPLRATDNPLVLPLLGLLLEQPRHQYALLAGLRERYRHLRVRTGSVYTLVGSLQEAGWITPSTASAPPVVFRLTPEGTKEVRRRVVTDIEDADPANSARFITALAYIGILDRASAVAALTARVAALDAWAADLERAVDTSGLAPIFMVEASFAASQTRHEIAWLEAFTAQIRDPSYDWPAEQAPAAARGRRRRITGAADQ
jgi:DNA-binding PadR family transcriptional regulator